MAIPFSWNLFTDLRTMWQFAFVRAEFEAGAMIAIVAGLIGYFVVLRRSSFATHALGHTGFSGAALAVLYGVSPVIGLLGFTTVTAGLMAALGRRASTRDVEVGTVLAFALGLGLLFLSLYQGYATEAYSILFGDIEGISPQDVTFIFWTMLAIVAVVAVLYRPLLFSSIDEDVAEARGLRLTVLNLVFLELLAVTISIAVQIIGVLLIFALMVTPAATAVRLANRPLWAIPIAIGLAMVATFVGVFAAFYTPYPPSFFITAIAFAIYLIVRGAQAILARTMAPTTISAAPSASPSPGP